MRKFSSIGRFVPVVPAVLAMLAPATGLPQGTASGGALEEMTVTAQRREQNVQEIPVSVTAFNAEALALQNINDAQGYLALVPNVSFDDANQQGGARGINIAIRGIGNNNTDESAFIQSIGVYLDEFSVRVGRQCDDQPAVVRRRTDRSSARTPGYVLREKFRRRRPEYHDEETDGRRSKARSRSAPRAGTPPATSTDIGGVINRARPEINSPRDSWVTTRRIPASSRISSPVAKTAATTTRCCVGAFRFEPTDRIKLDAMLMYTDERAGHRRGRAVRGVRHRLGGDVLRQRSGRHVHYITAGRRPGVLAEQSRSKVAHSAIGQKTDIESLVGVFKVGWSIGDINLHWITGLIDTERQKVFDNDLLPEDIVRRYEQTEANSWSTELRFDWSLDRVNWIGGFLYSEDSIDQERLNTAGGGIRRRCRRLPVRNNGRRYCCIADLVAGRL